MKTPKQVQDRVIQVHRSRQPEHGHVGDGDPAGRGCRYARTQAQTVLLQTRAERIRRFGRVRPDRQELLQDDLPVSDAGQQQQEDGAERRSPPPAT